MATVGVDDDPLLSAKIYCRSCIAGSPNHHVSREEDEAWQKGIALSRHQRSGIRQLLTYDERAAAARTTKGPQERCSNCGQLLA